MKKLLTVLATLALAASFCAPSAHASGSKLRTVSPSWGTWTPQGFVAVADTTFLNGAVQTADTTGPVSTAGWDWSPFANSADLNAAALSVFKVFYSGALVSHDSAFVTAEFSMSSDFTTSATHVSSEFTMTQLGAGGGTQQVFATPVNLKAPVRNVVVLTAASATVGVSAPFPYVRFIVRGDGNTAARASALKLTVGYNHTDGRDGHKPRFEWERLRFGTYGPNGVVAGSEKDTSSVRFSAPDTTVSFDWSKALVGLSGNATSADTTALGAYLLLHVSSDPTGIDSFYVCVDGSPDNYRWNLTPLTGTAGGFLGSAVEAVVGSSGLAGILFGIPAHVVTALSAGPAAMPGTPFGRFRIFAGNGGEVAGGVKAWLGYRKNPYED